MPIPPRQHAAVIPVRTWRPPSETAFETLEIIFELHNADWRKGLEYVEKSRHPIMPEQIAARHHQISVSLQPDYASMAKCPEGYDRQLYLTERAQERCDTVSCGLEN